MTDMTGHPTLCDFCDQPATKSSRFKGNGEALSYCADHTSEGMHYRGVYLQSRGLVTLYDAFHNTPLELYGFLRSYLNPTTVTFGERTVTFTIPAPIDVNADDYFLTRDADGEWRFPIRNEETGLMETLRFRDFIKGSSEPHPICRLIRKLEEGHYGLYGAWYPSYLKPHKVVGPKGINAEEAADAATSAV
jgi:hypothetical protein